MQVVGIAADVTTATGIDGPLPILYEPWSPEHGRYLGFARFSGEQGEIASAIGATIRQGVPDVSVSVQVVQASIDEDVRLIHQVATLIGALAALAVGLAIIGVYGVVSFSVRRRTKELGVRIALGATATDIYKVVARGYSRPIIAGMVSGLFISVPAALFVQRSFGGGGHLPILDRASPFAFAAAVLTMCVVTALAIAGPARRAGVTDPLTALRTE
jgi:ABC-type antimicrobial peptide transport system permease subunit